VSRWAPVIIYMALIFALSSIRNPPLPPGPLISDKPLHGILYAGLSALVVRALAGGWLGEVTLGIAVRAVGISTLYGVTDELHQYFVPPRQADIRDVGADLLGAAVAALALYVIGQLATRSGTRTGI
jgi:VanZ family protein